MNETAETLKPLQTLTYRLTDLWKHHKKTTVTVTLIDLPARREAHHSIGQPARKEPKNLRKIALLTVFKIMPNMLISSNWIIPNYYPSSLHHYINSELFAKRRPRRTVTICIYTHGLILRIFFQNLKTST